MIKFNRTDKSFYAASVLFVTLWAVIQSLAVSGSADYQWLGVFLSFSPIFLIVSEISVESTQGEKNETKDAEIALELKAYAHDSTTMLPNQQHAITVLENVTKTNQELIVIVFKPINFHQINEVIGHENANLLLLQLAFCLQNKSKEVEHLINLSEYESDSYVARLQSMNFMVVADLSQARFGSDNLVSVVHRALLDAVPQAFSFRNYSLNFELAFGACPLDIVENNVNLAITAAGDALVQAEKDGSRFVFFDSEKQLYNKHRIRMLEQLSHSVEKGELDLYFQPQMNLNSREVTGIEALVRWQHPEEGVIEAEQFIKLAEQCGVIFAITRWVINRVCSVVGELKQQGLNFPVSVNLSGKDLLEAELIDYLHHQLSENGLSTKDIILEIDEQDIVHAPNNKSDVIKRLVTEKFTIVLDNFLGGYDTLEPIRNLNIHSVKLDCSSLKLEKAADADIAIMGALISLANSLDIQVIGKNIESGTASSRFANIGGYIGQGKFLTKPLPFDNLLEWLTRRELVNQKPK